MSPCQTTEDLLFDYLYELLEDEEANRLREHISTCSDCAERLEKARQQCNLLARAAHNCLDVAPFAHPERQLAQPQTVPEETASIARDETLTNMPVKSKRPWLRWAVITVAAGLLLAIGGTAWSVRNELDSRQTVLAKARKQLHDINLKFVVQRDSIQEQAKHLPDKLARETVQLNVIGSGWYSADAGNQYRVHTASVDGKETSTKVQLCVRDKSSWEILHLAEEVTNNGTALVRVPAGLKARENSSLDLEFTAAGGESMTSTVKETIPIAPARYRTLVTTNKSTYQTGDILFFRTLTLRDFSRKPPEKPFLLRYSLVNTNGQQVYQVTNRSLANGVGGGEFALADKLKEGKYLLVVEDAQAKRETYVLPTAVTAVHVRNPSEPTVLVDRSQVLPGQNLNVMFQGRVLPTGMTLGNQPLTVHVRSKNSGNNTGGFLTVEPVQTRSDKYGMAAVELTVPKNLPDGPAEVEVQVHDGLFDETIRQEIAVGTVSDDLQVAAENPYLIPGVSNNIHVRWNVNSIPKRSLDCRLLDNDGQLIANYNVDGTSPKNSPYRIGNFAFTPTEKRGYKLVVESGSGKAVKPLPVVQKDGVAVKILNPLASVGKPIRVMLTPPVEERLYLVTAECRGQIVDQTFVTAKMSGTEVKLHPLQTATGEIRVNVFDSQANTLTPLAAQSVWRTADNSLKLAVRNGAVPMGDRNTNTAELLLECRDKTGQPADGWVLAMVTREEPESLVRLTDLSAMTFSSRLAKSRYENNDRDAFVISTSNQKPRTYDPTGVSGAYSSPRTTNPTPTSAVRQETVPIIHLSNSGSMADRYQKTLQTRKESLKEDFRRQQAKYTLARTEAERNVQSAETALEGYEQQLASIGPFLLGLAIAVLFVVGLVAVLIGIVLSCFGRVATRTLVVGFSASTVCLLLYGSSAGLRTQLVNVTETTQPHANAKFTHKDISPDWGVIPPAKGPVTTTIPTGKFRLVTVTETPTPTNIMTQPISDPKNPNEFKNNGELFVGQGGFPDLGGGGGGVGYYAYNPFGARKQNYRFQQALCIQNAQPVGQTDGLTLDTAVRGCATHLVSPGGIGHVVPPISPSNLVRGIALRITNPGTPTPDKKTANGKGGTENAGSVAHLNWWDYSYKNAPANYGPSDTLLWNTTVPLTNGKGQVRFELPNDVQNYRVYLFGHDENGRLGVLKQSLTLPKAK